MTSLTKKKYRELTNYEGSATNDAVDGGGIAGTVEHLLPTQRRNC